MYFAQSLTTCRALDANRKIANECLTQIPSVFCPPVSSVSADKQFIDGRAIGCGKNPAYPPVGLSRGSYRLTVRDGVKSHIDIFTHRIIF